MLTIVWGVTGFHVVKLLPKGGNFNANEYTNEILSEIACWGEAQGGGTNRKLVVHAENAVPFTSRKTNTKLKWEALPSKCMERDTERFIVSG
jgi:hypothetical protein